MGEWKIQLTTNIHSISSKEHDDRQLMHCKSHDIEIMTRNETDEIIKELFQSLLARYINERQRFCL